MTGKGGHQDRHGEMRLQCLSPSCENHGLGSTRALQQLLFYSFFTWPGVRSGMVGGAIRVLVLMTIPFLGSRCGSHELTGASSQGYIGKCSEIGCRTIIRCLLSSKISRQPRHLDDTYHQQMWCGNSKPFLNIRKASATQYHGREYQPGWPTAATSLPDRSCQVAGLDIGRRKQDEST